jgi:UDPglucose 6-dehydrogenase|tara:strand:- start:2322 stop:3176 length:855 start_codon:yes stop_codon:yes gene_type:complete
MNIGIVGHGFVGKAIAEGFRSKCTIFINDPKFPRFSMALEKMVDQCRYIFVSVSTPSKQNGEFDGTNISQVINDLNRLNKDRASNMKTIVIVKSAVIPSIVKQWVKTKKNIHLIISPEYLSDKDGPRQFVNQKLFILGGETKYCNEVLALYEKYSICNNECPVGLCTEIEASFIKYMENSFLATKVIFMNDFFKLFKSITGSSELRWDEVMEIFHYDKRMGSSHYKVPGHDGDYGFGGRCLPKDIRAIIWDSAKQNIDLEFLRNVWDRNLSIRSLHDWEPKETP